ncbi:MAG: hypothetical protein A2X94_00615 [Bdellovibrionales bacterium GWB1_55_8]|nr:MAG: hypothetical protein A2X94_00615 [Bdellovibrionales bacterium GWB1_55_8]
MSSENPVTGAPIKNLLVDLDGTLLGNRSVFLSLDFVGKAVSTLKMYGSWSTAARTLLAIYREFRVPSAQLTNDVRVIELFSKRMKLEPTEGRRVLREAVQAIFPQLEKHFFPIEGAREFLDWAKEHYPLTLATNPVWPSEIMNLRLKWAGIDPEVFSFVTDVRIMQACKPSPAYYQQILKNREYRAEDCLLIGNDLKMDLPASRVGIRVFIVGNFETMEELPVPTGSAKAWKGNYSHLKTLLAGMT